MRPGVGPPIPCRPVTKLNQIIAIEKGVKADAAGALTRAYHDLQKGALLSGIARSYQPRDDEGEQLPPESTRGETLVWRNWHSHRSVEPTFAGSSPATKTGGHAWVGVAST